MSEAKNKTGGCLCGAARFASGVYLDHKPDSHAFAGERPRMTEADVLELVGAANHD